MKAILILTLILALGIMGCQKDDDVSSNDKAVTMKYIKKLTYHNSSVTTFKYDSERRLIEESYDNLQWDDYNTKKFSWSYSDDTLFYDTHTITSDTNIHSILKIYKVGDTIFKMIDNGRYTKYIINNDKVVTEKKYSTDQNSGLYQWRDIQYEWTGDNLITYTIRFPNINETSYNFYEYEYYNDKLNGSKGNSVDGLWPLGMYDGLWPLGMNSVNFNSKSTLTIDDDESITIIKKTYTVTGDDDGYVTNYNTHDQYGTILWQATIEYY